MRRLLAYSLATSVFLPLIAFADSASCGNAIFCNPIGINGANGQVSTIPELLYALVDVFIKLLIPIIGVLIVYTGFEFATAKGDPAKIKKARTALTWIVIGTFVILGAKGFGMVISNTVNSLK